MIKFDEFEHVDKSAWVKEAERLLRGKPLSKLNWEYEPNLQVGPYYDQSTVSQAQASVLTRSLSESGFRTIEFLKLDGDTNKRSLNALNMGAEGVFMDIDSIAFESSMLTSILPEHCWFGISCGTRDLSRVLSFLDAREADRVNFNGLISTPWLLKVGTGLGFRIDLERLLRPTNIFEEFENIRTIEIPLHSIQEEGASISLELSVLLGSLKIIIEQCQNQNIAIDGLVKKMQISTAVSTDFYHEIAKLRAIRKLTYKLFRAYKLPCAVDHISIVGRTSSIVNSSLDSDTNYLRKTTQALSIVLGAADGLMITPYEPKGYDENERRIVRNIGNLIKEETYGHWVQDPIAGSYYVEELTEKLCEKGWERFREVESKGGLMTWSKDGRLSEAIKVDQERAYQEMDSRKKTMVGVNNYPNAPISNQVGKSNIDFRYSRKFESLQSLVQQAVDNGEISEWPKVQPVAVGVNAAMVTARLNFSTNLLGCGGFQLLQVKCLDEVGDSSPDVIVLCGADEDYEKLKSDRIAELRKQAKVILLAGHPENAKELLEIGIDMLVHVKSKVLTTNTAILKTLEII